MKYREWHPVANKTVLRLNRVQILSKALYGPHYLTRILRIQL